MTLASLKKTQANRVLGIDASTNSIAFCLMENDQPLKWGKINIVGNDIYEKIYDAKKKIYFCDSKYDADLIIYFSDSKYDAQWRNNSKKSLMY
jgi:hypothetical protein